MRLLRDALRQSSWTGPGTTLLRWLSHLNSKRMRIAIQYMSIGLVTLPGDSPTYQRSRKQALTLAPIAVSCFPHNSTQLERNGRCSMSVTAGMRRRGTFCVVMAVDAQYMGHNKLAAKSWSLFVGCRTASHPGRRALAGIKKPRRDRCLRETDRGSG